MRASLLVKEGWIIEDFFLLSVIADDVRQPEPVRGADGPEPVHGAGGGVGEGGAPRPRVGEAAEKGKNTDKPVDDRIVTENTDTFRNFHMGIWNPDTSP